MSTQQRRLGQYKKEELVHPGKGFKQATIKIRNVSGSVRGRPALQPPATPPTSFTDNFGSKIHGPELNHHLKSPQIRAAETCLVARGDNQTINMLRQPPCRHILTGEYFFSAAQIVSYLSWY